MGNSEYRGKRREPDLSSGFRSLRLEQLFLEELNSILDGEISDRRFDGARVSRVEISRDGASARVWVALTAPGEAQRARDVVSAFERAQRFFRSRLCDALELKRTPELTFKYDPTYLLQIDPE
ncbi:MAG TPA: 30S ribosome-binding factor RbfA [Polyangiaceae bacterium]|nr:30S ribosome-binding factor RbfA [Polyangiaceae bacterium]